MFQPCFRARRIVVVISRGSIRALRRRTVLKNEFGVIGMVLRSMAHVAQLFHPRSMVASLLLSVAVPALAVFCRVFTPSSPVCRGLLTPTSMWSCVGCCEWLISCAGAHAETSVPWKHALVIIYGIKNCGTHFSQS